MKVLVRALTRTDSTGGTFAWAWRAGRRWSAEEPTEVEVVDADEDPPPTGSGIIRICRATLAALEADPHLTVTKPGQPRDPAQAVKAKRLREAQQAEATANERRRKRAAERERQERMEEAKHNRRRTFF